MTIVGLAISFRATFYERLQTAMSLVESVTSAIADSHWAALRATTDVKSPLAGFQMQQSTLTCPNILVCIGIYD